MDVSKKKGMGAVNIETYANSLRCSWFKRIKSGFWSKILLAKVENSRNCCFIQTKDIHKMHISIIPIVKAFEALQSAFLEVRGNCARINTPLDQLALIRNNTVRRRNQDGAKPTKTTHPNIFKTGNICEISGNDLSVPNTVYTDSPKLKPDEDRWTIIGIGQLLFLRKAEILSDIKKLFKILTKGRDFTNNDEATSLPEVQGKKG